MLHFIALPDKSSPAALHLILHVTQARVGSGGRKPVEQETG